jgi:DnaJ family protein B protein 13
MAETDQCYYKMLGLEHTANREQIAQAYHRLSLKFHPLRNDQAMVSQCIHQFSRVNEAYEVLSNPKTKAIYDKYGMESLKNGISEGPDACEGYLFSGQPYKIFEKFFGSANPFVSEQHPEDRALDELQKIDAKARKEDIQVTVECELHEFYCGALKEINYGRVKMQAATEAFTVKN